jgi:hypothetical protein
VRLHLIEARTFETGLVLLQEQAHRKKQLENI